MSARGKEFISIVPTSEKRPQSNFASPYAGLNIVRDNFELTTWIGLGALLQGALFLVFGRLALIPAAAFLLYQSLDAYAQAIGLKRNKYMDDVIMKKTSAVFPDEEGKYGNKPSNSDLVVFHIGVRYNHPLGLFGKNGQVVADAFGNMIKELEAHADEFGFLGASSYQSLAAASKNELLIVCYFRNVDGLHTFAHSQYHMPTWQWWNKEYSKMPHIAIFHETYHVPAGNWESIHINSQISGINSTVFKIAEEMTGKEVYARPMVDASKGLLKTSAGRMARSQGNEHEKVLDVDPYDK